MSKYDKLWEFVRKNCNSELKLTFDQIREIAGVPLDHSFLNYKKDLIQYGYKVGKISIKDKTVIFEKQEKN